MVRVGRAQPRRRCQPRCLPVQTVPSPEARRSPAASAGRDPASPSRESWSRGSCRRTPARVRHRPGARAVPGPPIPAAFPLVFPPPRCSSQGCPSPPGPSFPAVARLLATVQPGATASDPGKIPHDVMCQGSWASVTGRSVCPPPPPCVRAHRLCRGHLSPHVVPESPIPMGFPMVTCPQGLSRCHTSPWAFPGSPTPMSCAMVTHPQGPCRGHPCPQLPQGCLMPHNCCGTGTSCVAGAQGSHTPRRVGCGSHWAAASWRQPILSL